ncbi:putative ABC transport system permease protein [Actinoplanes lutulentus]|uniref:Putative ABC transport system permease protein n=1 Tax=Actinoplanes lutulentus TaxID=1287878 RepID=A0A327ZJG6_9ACTN|nr:ABC transporter permease [Actinoplanes lutulentus]MBB2943968.1 putative ABC transport system permease protein [Actinoplanes lutulentus]RAK42799.1 putative ABC transport system permease protein [Actinoplanes lutulentus]
MSAAWAMVRHRFASFAGTFVAVALGVAVLAASATLQLSSKPQAPARYDAAPLLVLPPETGTNDYGEPERPNWTPSEATDLAGKLTSLPGVTAAVPDPSFYIQRLIDGKATGDPQASRINGHAWSSAALGGYQLAAGRPPTKAGEVAAAGTTPGERIEVLTARGPETWTVTGTVIDNGHHAGFFVADSVAFARASGVPLIGLTLTGDDGWVAAAARALIGPAGVVLAGADRDQLEPGSVSRIRWIGAQLLIVLVALGAFATVFVVSSTCALSAAQRRRELGLLRAVGATPGQVRRMMYAETTLIALFAGVIGAPIGALFAPLLADPMVETGLEPPGFAATWQPLALAGAVLVGLFAALAGVVVAARRASRISPLDALRESAADPRPMPPSRWVTGIASAAAGGALLAVMPSLSNASKTTAGLGAAMLLITAAALLSPVLIVPIVRLLAAPWRNSATGMLVREGTLTGVRRVASTAAPVLATVGLTVLLTGMIATIEVASGIDEAAEYPVANLLVPLNTPGLSEAAVATQSGTSRLPTRVQVTVPTTTRGYDGAGLTGPESSPVGPAGGVGERPGSEAGAGAVLHADTAGELGVAAGATIALRFADGTRAELPVLAVDPNAEAPIVLPRALVRAHDPDALTDMVVLNGPATEAAGAESLPVATYVQREVDDEGRLVDLFLWAMISLSAGYTGIAVGNTLLMAVAARRAELRVLRLAGATRRQILGVLAAESLLAVGVGAVLGAAVAAISLLGIRAAVESELGQAVTLVIPWTAAAAVTTGCALIALVAAAVPTLHRPTGP